MDLGALVKAGSDIYGSTQKKTVQVIQQPSTPTDYFQKYKVVIIGSVVGFVALIGIVLIARR